MGVAWIERLDPRLDPLLPPGTVVEQIAGGIEWAEGPVWDRRANAFLFSDTPRNAIYRWRAGKGVDLYLERSGYTGAAPFTGREPGSNGLAFDAEGRLVLCRHGQRDVARREPDGTVTVLADRFLGKRLNSPNDLVFRRNGDLYFTDPPYGLPGTFDDPARETGFAGVYRLAKDGRLHLVVDELEAPNGIAFSPDEETLYVSNSRGSPTGWMAYPVRPDGGVGPGRLLVDATPFRAEGEGSPDGFEVDVHGNLFAAGPGGVHVLTPAGERLGRIVTGGRTGNVAWGEDGSVLFVAANHVILRVPTRTRAAVF